MNSSRWNYSCVLSGVSHFNAYHIGIFIRFIVAEGLCLFAPWVPYYGGVAVAFIDPDNLSVIEDVDLSAAVLINSFLLPVDNNITVLDFLFACECIKIFFAVQSVNA